MIFKDYSHLFLIDPRSIALNHGSFGAVPLEIVNYQFSLIKRMESLTTKFFTRELPSLLEESLHVLTDFINAPYENTVFIKNATSAVNAVLNSIPFKKNDEIVTTNLIYASCRKTLEHISACKGVVVRQAEIPFPAHSDQKIFDTIMALVNNKTKLIFIDHISSETATVMPVEKIIEEASKAGIDTFIDGAHAPGMIPLDIKKLNPTYYTGNCHKWLYTPKGSAFMYVKSEKIDQMTPPVISNNFREGKSGVERFRNSFDWSATMDYSSFVCVGRTIKYLENEVEGGWREIMKRNHQLVISGRNTLSEILDTKNCIPDEMTGSMVTIKLGSKAVTDKKTGLDVLQIELLDRYNVEALITTLYPTNERILRISAALYNNRADYETLLDKLKILLF